MASDKLHHIETSKAILIKAVGLLVIEIGCVKYKSMNITCFSNNVYNDICKKRNRHDACIDKIVIRYMFIERVMT